jgi:adenosylhomocysteine nucleosidase
VQRVDVAFLVAMNEEIEGIFDPARWSEVDPWPFGVRRRERWSRDAIVVQTGIGTTNAAAAAQYTLDRFDPRRIVNLGLVGCLDPAIAIGTVHAVDVCAFFDVDATVFGYKFGQIPRTSVTEYKLARRETALPQARLISGDTFVTDPGAFHPDLGGFEADFVDMELAAIAHTLFRNNRLSLLESYKAASDYCNGESTEAFESNMPAALAGLAGIAERILRDVEEEAGA